MNENFNQVNNNNNNSFTDYQANQSQNGNATQNQYDNNVFAGYQTMQPNQQQNVVPETNQYGNNSFVYNDENNQDFKQKSNSGLVRIILIVLGIIIIVILVVLLLKFCGGGKLTGITLSGGINSDNELITYVDETKTIEFNTTGSGDRSETVFTFEISAEDIAKVKNNEQIGESVENKVTGLSVGETSLEVVASLGKNKFSKDVTVIVCDRLDVSSIADNTINVNVSETKKINLNLGTDSRCYAALSTTFAVEGIATIDDDFNVTGITGGTTKLTISDGENSKEFTIVVTDPNAAVIANSITVSPTSKTLKVNSTQKISVEILPANTTNKSVSYSSNKTSVATVSQNGVITAKSVGTATISVMTLDGSDKKATVQVTVTKATTSTTPTNPNVSVTGINFALSSYSATIGSGVTAGVVFTPDNATNKTLKSCQSDNTKYATATVSGNSCIINGVAAGTTTITATSTDGAKTATTSVTVSDSGNGGGGGGNNNGKIKYTVKVSVANGSGSGSKTVVSGGNVSFPISPNDGYGNPKVTGCQCSATTNSLSCSNVTSNQTCSVLYYRTTNVTKKVYKCTKISAGYTQTKKICTKVTKPMKSCLCSNFKTYQVDINKKCSDICYFYTLSSVVLYTSYYATYEYNMVAQPSTNVSSCTASSGGVCKDESTVGNESVSCSENYSYGFTTSTTSVAKANCSATSSFICSPLRVGEIYTECK